MVLTIDAEPSHVPPGTRVSVRFVLSEEEAAQEDATAAHAGL